MVRMDRPGVLERARVAWRVFRRGVPARKAAGGEKFPLIWPAWRRGQPQWKMTDFDNFAEEGFERNALIYEAIMYKVRAKWLAPLRAYTGEMDRPERLADDHPLAKLIARPNPKQSQADFEAALIAFLNLDGNAYGILKRPRGGGLPEAMYTVRPDRMYIVPHPQWRRTREILGYLYVPEGMGHQDGIPMLAQDVMHIKFPNPRDPYDGLGYGQSPVLSMARSADVDNAVTHFLKLFFERGALIPGMVSFDVSLDDSTMARVKERWMEIYGGYENWTDIFVADNSAKYQRVGATFDEFGFGQLDERNETRILGPLGVPAVLVGARVGLQNATYANVNGLRRVFWEDTFKPELGLFEDEYRYYLVGEDGAWVGYDYAGVPALQQDRAALADAAYKIWQMGTPANQAFASVGLAIEDVPGGDTAYVSVSMVASGSSRPAETVREGAQGDAGQVEAEEDEREEGKAALAFWEERARRARGNGKIIHEGTRGGVASESVQSEAVTLPAVVPRPDDEWRLMLAALTEERMAALAEKRTVDWERVAESWRADVVELSPDEEALLTQARREGWTVDRMTAAVGELYAEHEEVMATPVAPFRLAGWEGYP